MTDVFNLDAVAAEAEGRPPFLFVFGGEEYELPGEVNMIAAGALSEGLIFKGLEWLLGPDQWVRMQDSETVLTDGMLSALFEKYQEHVGTTMGESPASTRSSLRAVKPSRRTSNGTTKRRSAV